MKEGIMHSSICRKGSCFSLPDTKNEGYFGKLSGGEKFIKQDMSQAYIPIYTCYLMSNL